MSITFEVEPYLDPGEESGLDDLYAYDEQHGEDDFEVFNVNPTTPTLARPGSEDKVTMLAARYAAGLPLWHEDDCCDHGPGEIDLMGLRDL